MNNEEKLCGFYMSVSMEEQASVFRSKKTD